MPEDIKTNRKMLARYIDNARRFPRTRSFFWLLRCTDALNKYAAMEIKKTGDTHSRIRIAALQLLIKYPDGISQQEIAKQTGRTKQAIVVAIDNLVKKGEVTKTLTTNDRRTNSIRITKVGIEHLSKVFPDTMEMCNKALSSLSSEEVDQLLSIIMKLTKNIWQKIEGQS